MRCASLPTVLCVSLTLGSLASAQVPADAPVDAPLFRWDEEFSVMKALSSRDLHTLQPERWNVYGQFTYISSWKLPFNAPYTNFGGGPHSLLPDAERSFTGTLTLAAGVALWKGAEVYAVPEVIIERPLSTLAGLAGAIQNFELQKTGSEAPTLYLSRVYFTQTINLGGEQVVKPSHAMQLGAAVDKRRVVLSVGNFSILDFFDKNTFSGDLRRQFFNMSFLTHAAFDFAADARGYSWGGVAELFFDDWAFRIGHMAPPVHPNQLEVDFRVWQFFGDQVEVEHDHTLFGQPGVVRLLAYRNRENMGRFTKAIAAFDADRSQSAANCTEFNYGSTNPNAPDLCWARTPEVKLGLGVNLEQQVSEDLGLFFRGMYSDGFTEVYSYTAADRSMSFGALAKGTRWHRPADLFGIGVGIAWASPEHLAYLARGGVDGFIGDGRISGAPESVVEIFYSARVVSSLWLAADYQRITNPGFNADRGPVDIYGAKLHGEF